MSDQMLKTGASKQIYVESSINIQQYRGYSERHDALPRDNVFQQVELSSDFLTPIQKSHGTGFEAEWPYPKWPRTLIASVAAQNLQDT
jgi:hypothetical protein